MSGERLPSTQELADAEKTVKAVKARAEKMVTLLREDREMAREVLMLLVQLALAGGLQSGLQSLKDGK